MSPSFSCTRDSILSVQFETRITLETQSGTVPISGVCGGRIAIQ